MNFIKELLAKWSCPHVWERYHRTTIVKYRDSLPQEILDTLICKKCGKIKTIYL